MRTSQSNQKSAQEQTLTVLEFQAHSDKWAIPALDIIRIIEKLPVEQLPQENLALSGFVTYENERVPFMSLGQLLEGQGADEGPMIIFDHHDGKIALGLNQVFNLKRVPVSQIKPLPTFFAQESYKNSMTTCYFDGDLIVPIVDLKQLEF